MQFVLDDQGWRQETRAAEQLPSDPRLSRAIKAVLVFAIDVIEEGADFVEERQAREFIYCGDEKGR